MLSTNVCRQVFIELNSYEPMKKGFKTEVLKPLMLGFSREVEPDVLQRHRCR